MMISWWSVVGFWVYCKITRRVLPCHSTGRLDHILPRNDVNWSTHQESNIAGFYIAMIDCWRGIQNHNLSGVDALLLALTSWGHFFHNIPQPSHSCRWIEEHLSWLNLSWSKFVFFTSQPTPGGPTLFIYFFPDGPTINSATHQPQVTICNNGQNAGSQPAGFVWEPQW